MSKHLVDKTRVYQVDSEWFIRYYWPYSGVLVVECASWQDAMVEACGIERNRGWV